MEVVRLFGLHDSLVSSPSKMKELEVVCPNISAMVHDDLYGNNDNQLSLLEVEYV